MSQISGPEREKENFRSDFLQAFSSGNKDYRDWLLVDPLKLLDDAKDMLDEIDKKIHSYRPLSFILILLIIAAAILTGVANYLSA